IHDKGYRVGNADITIIAQAPKMAPHIQTMREYIAADLQVRLDDINVKATTTEKLGFTGRKEGIAVEAVALPLTVERFRTPKPELPWPPCAIRHPAAPCLTGRRPIRPPAPTPC